MATFGYTSVNGVKRHWTDWAGGSWYTMNAENGDLTTVEVKATRVAGNANTKVFLYDVVANKPVNLLATSDVVVIGAVDQFYLFTIAHALTSGTQYAFIIMNDADIWVHMDAGGHATQFNQASGETYPNPPDPFGVPESSADSMECIRATYTPSGGATVKKGSNLANTMTTMLNSKMLFSACNRFPKLNPRHF